MLSMLICERGSMKVFAQDALFMGIMLHVGPPCLEQVNIILETPERTLVLKFGGQDLWPCPLESVDELLEGASQKGKGTQLIDSDSVDLDRKSNPVQSLTQDFRQCVVFPGLTKKSNVEVFHDHDTGGQTAGITQGLNSSKQLGIKERTFQNALQVRIDSRSLQSKSLHERGPQPFNMFATNDKGRNGMHCTRPSHSLNQLNFLAEGTWAQQKLMREIHGNGPVRWHAWAVQTQWAPNSRLWSKTRNPPSRKSRLLSPSAA